MKRILPFLFSLTVLSFAQDTTKDTTNTHGERIDTSTERNAFLTALAGTSVTATELSYVSGLSSNIQSQFNGKLSLTGGTLTGALSIPNHSVTAQSITLANGNKSLGWISDTLTYLDITGKSATLSFANITGTGRTIFVPDASGTLALTSNLTPYALLASPTFTGTVVLPSTTSIGTITNTELSYVDGVTSSIQNQFSTKANLASPTFTGVVTLPTLTSIGSVTGTELGYVDGVTSSIQTQLNTISNNSVTLSGTQTITGLKDFQQAIVSDSYIRGTYIRATNGAWQTFMYGNETIFSDGVDTTTITPATGHGYSNITLPSTTGTLALVNNSAFTGNTTFDTNTLFVDGTNNRVGLGTAIPTEKLDVTGNIKASGTITSGGSAVVLATGNQTIAGNKTLTGETAFTSTTRPTSSGTGLPASNSLTTLSDARGDAFLDQSSKAVPLLGWAKTFVGSGVSNEESTGYLDFGAGSTTGSSTLVRCNHNYVNAFPVIDGGNPSMINWATRLRISFSMGMGNSDANTVIRFQVGEQNTKTTVSDLDQKGFGFKKVNEQLYILTHNGTTLTTSASVATLADGTYHHFLFDSDGSGNLTVYLNGNSIYTTTAPTGSSPFGFTALNFSAANGVGTAFSSGILFGTIKIKLGN